MVERAKAAYKKRRFAMATWAAEINHTSLFHKNRKWLLGDVMSFVWVNDFKAEFHVFM